MNFKKIVSAVSALAISVSAFAGLAVTANATMGTGTPADPYYDYNFDDWTTGTIVDSGLATSTVSATSTDGDLGFAVGSTSKNGGNIQIMESGSNKYMQIVAGQFSTDGRRPTITFNNAPTFATIGDAKNLVIEFDFANRSNTPVLVFAYDDTTKPIAEINVPTDFGIVASSSPSWYHAKIVLDGTNSKYTAAVTNSSDVEVATVAGNFANASAGFNKFGVTGGKSAAYLFVDNLKVYAEDKPAAPSHIMTINAVDGNGTFISALASVSVQENDVYILTGLAEVIEKNGTYYQLSPSVNNHTATFTMGTSDVTKAVTYIEDSSIAAYIEGESMSAQHSAYSAVYSDDAYSAGQARTTGGNPGEKIYKSITLADGIYTFVVGQGARKSSKNEPYTGDIMLDDRVIGSMTGTISGTTVNTFSNISVNAGTYELRAAVTNSAISPVDYIIIKRTADLPTASVSATSAIKDNYITFKGTIADVDDLTKVTKAGFGFVNLSDAVGSTSLSALWTDGQLTDNTFGAAIEMDGEASRSAFYGIPYMIFDGEAVFGNIVESAWN